MLKSIVTSLLLLQCTLVFAQDNYEIQVYGAKTIEKGYTMLELHSNFTFAGQEYAQEKVLPTHHMFHETIEITHGFTDWFETGFYIFNAIGLENRTTIVGSHIRPRVRIPDSWHWPLGLSLSAEIGYQKPEYSTNDVTFELRPIIDKTWGKYYFALNPVFETALHGPDSKSGFGFAPNAKFSYAVTKKAAFGLEYYGATGKPGMEDPLPQQQHLLFAAVDLEWSDDWEFNAGYGLGFTAASDNEIFKVILGYRFHRKEKGSPGLFRAAQKYIHFN